MEALREFGAFYPCWEGPNAARHDYCCGKYWLYSGIESYSYSGVSRYSYSKEKTKTEPIFDFRRLDVYRLSIDYVAPSFKIAQVLGDP